jgi:serine/threonine protein kinase/Tfp pilus assembly protein PilF
MANTCPRCRADNPETQRFCGECGTVLMTGGQASPLPTETLRTPVHELATGSTFAGRYQVIEELGKGGMGRVYKVFDTKINEKVALKLIKPEIASDRETLERFSNEMKLARKIGHRNVCRMFDLGEADGLHFLTMEYVHGEDLKSMVRMSGTLSIGAVLSVGKQVADGLAEAHRLGIVHRDLKPQNVMIDKGGNAKIMDFGIARSIREKGITGPSVMIGTPEYMSPEQAEAKEVDERSDIYSLGIILYEMATGHVPFEGETALSVAMKHKGEKPKDPRGLNPAISEDLSGLILKCLEKDKAKRYAGAVEVRSELEKIEKGIPTTERLAPKPKVSTTREITVKFRPKNLIIPALAFLALLGVAFVVFGLLSGKRSVSKPSTIPSLAILYFKNNTGDPKMDVWRSGLAESLITDISQSRYVRVLSWNEVFEMLKELNLLDAPGYTTEELMKVAQSGQVEYILQGSLSRAGDHYRIETSLRRIESGKALPPETARVDGTGEQAIFTMVDELTRKTKESLKLTAAQIASDLDYEIGKVTTSSVDALKYFQQGMDLQKLVKFNDAHLLYQKAIELDPEFALAYRGLAETAGNRAEHETAIKKAKELSGRLPEREQWRIEESFYEGSERTWDKAIDACSKILAQYPWDLDAANDLGVYYYWLEDNQKAIDVYENVLKYYPVMKSILFLGNLSAFYCTTGQFVKSEQILKNYLEKVGDSPLIYQYLGTTYLREGSYERIFPVADKILLLDPALKSDITLRGRAYQMQGRFAEAEREFEKLIDIENKSLSLQAKLSLVSLCLAQGRFGKAKQLLEGAMGPGGEYHSASESARQSFQGRRSYVLLAAGDFDRAVTAAAEFLTSAEEEDSHFNQRMAIWMRGLSYLAKGSVNDAETAASALTTQNIGAMSNKTATRLRDHLIGCIKLKEKDLDKAIASLERAKSMLPGLSSRMFWTGLFDAHPMFLAPLGEAYYLAGDLEKARAEFEALSRVTSDRIVCGDLWAKSLYWLGKIAEKQGARSEAVAHYRRFLDLWKDADPGQPEVEDAKARLKALL